MNRRDEKILYSLGRALCLADHMGDAWEDVRKTFRLLGLGFHEGEDGMPSFEAFEKAGGVSLYSKELRASRRKKRDEETGTT